jgi:prophage maintenance system killer protein
VFIELNGWSWAQSPTIDETEYAVLAIASGEWDVVEFAAWLRNHLAGPA